MKAKQQSPAATETWIHNVPEQKMKFTLNTHFLP